MSLVIVDYGVGNLASIQNMLKKAGVQSEITSDHNKIKAADKMMLAGVGAFDHCMQSLSDAGLVDVLNEKVLGQQTPVLGICVGLQMLTNGSEEGQLPGLGWIPGKVVKFDISRMAAPVKIPHMGWSEVTLTRQGKMIENINEESRFYFAHSYHAEVNDEHVLLYTTYGYRFPSAIQRANVFGVQFHPEKSHRFGMQILNNFVNL